MRVACPRNTGSTPRANGSSVPPWPTRRTPVRRRTRATMSCDVGPIGLSTTRMPSVHACRRVVARRARATVGVMRRASSSSSVRAVRQDRVAARARSARSIVAPAARAWPPPPNAPVSAVASTPPSRVRTVMRVRSPWSLNRIGDLGGLRLGEQVDEALRHLRAGAGRRRSRRARARTRRAVPVGVGLERGRAHARRAAAARWAWCGRCAARSCGRSAPAARSSRATRSVRGVVLGCWKLAVSMTTPAMRSAAMAPSRASSGRPARGSSSVTISHVAAASASTQSTAPKPRVRDVVVDVHDGHAREQLGMLGEHRTDALELAAVADDDEVGVEVGLGRLPEAVDVGHEVVHRGHRVRADGVDPRAQRLERERRPRAPSRARRPPGRDGRPSSRDAPRAGGRGPRPAPPRGRPASAPRTVQRPRLPLPRPLLGLPPPAVHPSPSSACRPRDQLAGGSGATSASAAVLLLRGTWARRRQRPRRQLRRQCLRVRHGAARSSVSICSRSSSPASPARRCRPRAGAAPGCA